MNLKQRGALVVAVALLAGCVPSLNPIYNQDQLVFDNKMLGVWQQPQSAERWEFTKRNETSYRLVYRDKNGQSDHFEAHLANIDGTLFLDLFPEEMGKQRSGLYRLHLVPIHTIYTVKRSESHLTLATMDFKWLDKYLSENPNAIRYATMNGRKMITASTEDLQAFLLKHKDRFTGKLVLKRQASDVN